MKQEVLIALVIKLVEQKLDAEFEARALSVKAHRGPRGPAGEDGKSFVFAEHEETIKSWVKEYSLKFSDLTEDQLEDLRGPKGHEGKKGDEGKSFIFEEHKNAITELVYNYFSEIHGDLKLKFSDLTEEDKEELRGPRGQRGKAGKDFDFEEHREFFEGLKLKFTDLTKDEVDKLKLKFSDLESEDIEQLKLKFTDLTPEEVLSLQGPRGQRGKRGEQGSRGDQGPQGERGMPGARGPIGLTGNPGRDGRDGINGAAGNNGADAPVVTSVDIVQDKDYFKFVFYFSDGTTIETDEVRLPAREVHYYPVGVGGGSGSSEGGSGTDGKSAYEIAVENGFVGDEVAWLASLQGPAGADGLDGATGPQGPAGIDGADAGASRLLDVECGTDVFVGAWVVLDSDVLSDGVMSDWPNLIIVPQLQYSEYNIVARNAQADALENSNVIGVVDSKPTPTSCNITTGGETPELFIGLDVNQEYYLSDTLPGRMVTAANIPTDPGTVLLKLGQPVSSKKLFVRRGDRVIQS